ESTYGRGTKIDNVIPAEDVFVDLPEFIASGGGEDAPVSVEIPEDVAAGTYEGWITVFGNEGVDDGILVRLVVNETEDLDIAEASVEIAGYVEHGSTEATPDFTVYNTDLANNPDPDGPGNTTLYGIHFVADNLFNAGGTRFISKDNIDFEPDNISSLESGTYTTAHAVIHIPVGTYATTYSGLVTAINGSGSVSDTVRVILTVAESPYFHIADNEGNLVENTMYVVGDVGTTTPETHFVIKNPIGVGNVDLTCIASRVNGLEDFTVEFDPRTYDVEYGSYTIGALTVSIPEDQNEGVYTGWVVLEYSGGEKNGVVSDSFTLSVTVLPDEIVALSVDTLKVTGREGTTGSEYFSVLNLGNVILTDLELIMLTDLEDVSGTVISRDRVKFTYPVVDTLGIGGSERVLMSVDIPKFTMEGVFTGRFEVRDEKDGMPSYEAVVELRVTSETELTYDENPVTGTKVTIRCKGDDDADPGLTIFNLAGEIVRYKVAMETPKYKGDDVPTWTYTWELDNDEGKKVASGMYVILVSTKINDEVKVLKDKILVIR
ncbi:hypothetical protein KAX35_02070, partial [candidate division WOR-3 bacterium]|nr:hypothetical protein [candidate division WOR-3 bacterium]